MRLPLPFPATLRRAQSLGMYGALACLGLTLAGCGDSLIGMALIPPQEVGIPVSWHSLSSVDLETGIESTSSHEGTFAAYLHGSSDTARGGISQQIAATAYAGKRLKLTAWVNESFLSTGAALFAEIDSPGKSAITAASIKPPAGGSDIWHPVSLVFDVPADAGGFTIVGDMTGSGQVFFDSMTLDVVDSTTAVTTLTTTKSVNTAETLATLYAQAFPALTNGSFDQGVVITSAASGSKHE